MSNIWTTYVLKSAIAHVLGHVLLATRIRVWSHNLPLCGYEPLHIDQTKGNDWNCTMLSTSQTQWFRTCYSVGLGRNGGPTYVVWCCAEPCLLFCFVLCSASYCVFTVLCGIMCCLVFLDVLWLLQSILCSVLCYVTWCDVFSVLVFAAWAVLGLIFCAVISVLFFVLRSLSCTLLGACRVLRAVWCDLFCILVCVLYCALAWV